MSLVKTGKVLTISLQKKTTSEKKLTQDEVQQYFGGRGLGAYLYSANVKKPADKDNSVFITPGFLTGSVYSCSSRLNFTSSSPLTGLLINSSAGGKFGAYLKSQNIWSLEITGQADEWTVLIIDKDGVRFANAKNVVGKNVYETRECLKSQYDGNCSIASIGRGGENLVKFSIVQFDNRATGRGGSGWHFGYKRLKAVLVELGDLPVLSENKELEREIMKSLHEKRIKHEKVENITTYATAPTTVAYANELEAFPASNYRRNFITAEELEGLDAEAFQKRVTRKEACWSCPLACTSMTEGKFAEVDVKGPEYETVWALGANCDNFDMDVVIECSRLCDDYGLDTISTGSVLGWYKECIDKGDIKAKWSEDLMFKLIEQIGSRTGVGDQLAEGVVKASELLNVGQTYVAHSKKLELPAWDPRTAIGMAINYVTAPTGGDHCKGWTVSYDANDKNGRFSPTGKAANVVKAQNRMVLRDMLGTCMFGGFLYTKKTIIKVLLAFTGEKFTTKELNESAEQIFQLEHKINNELGLKLEDNVLPPRIIGYEVEVGGKKVQLDKELFNEMLDEYYKIRGWG